MLNTLEIPFVPLPGRRWRVMSPIVWSGRGVYTEVPVGFITDFASVPRIFWSIYPPTGDYKLAAVVHDYLYVVQSCTRIEADDTFKFIMEWLDGRSQESTYPQMA